MLSQFNNDKVYISTKWLLRLINGRGLNILYLLRIIHLGTNATHYLAILPDNRYVCDCCMGINLGIPCRHYFQALTSVKAKGLQFHVGLIRARYLFFCLIIIVP